VARGGRRFILLQVIILAATGLVASASALWLSYHAARATQKSILSQSSRQLAALVESIAGFNARHGAEGYPGGAKEAAVQQVIDAHHSLEDSEHHAEWQLARLEGDRVRFLLAHGTKELAGAPLTPVRMGDPAAVPMQRALRGQSGTMVALDHHERMVLASYEPIRTLQAGLVHLFPINRLDTPFLQAAAVASVLTIFGVLAAALLASRTARAHLRALSELHSQYKSILDSTTDAILAIDSSGAVLFANAATARLSGHSIKEMVGGNISKLMPSPHREEHDGYLTRYLRTGERRILGTEQEVDLLRKDGRTVPVALRVSEMEQEGERVFVGVLQDITARRADQAFRETMNAILRSSLRSVSLVEFLREALGLVLSLPELGIENKGAIFLMEDGALSMKAQHGLSGPVREECAQVPLGKCLCGRAAASGENVFSEKLDERHEVRYDGMQPHGHYCVPIKSGGAVLGVFTIYLEDGMARSARTEDALESFADALALVIERRRSEAFLEKLSRVVRETQDCVVITDAEGRIEYVNPAFTEVSGYSAQEALEKTPRLLSSGSHSPGTYRELWGALKEGRHYRGTLVNKKKNGELYHAEQNISPVRDASGKVTHFVSVSRDVTERKRLEEAVRQSEKLGAVGQLAAGVAHELNNPLGVILGFAQSAARRLEDGDHMELPIRSIEREALRCKSLVQDLLAFARKGKEAHETLDLSEAVRAALALVESQARVRGAALEKDIEPGLMAAGSRQDLQQVVVNLAGNALDAMADSGTLSVALRREGSEAVLSVKDTGKGIPEDVRRRIFEPFFTTKEVGKGTGLGLSLAHETVTKHGGTIICDSVPGRGAVFTVRLPLEADESA